MEIIYAIVKRNTENFYIECSPTDKVMKIKSELIKYFVDIEEENMRLMLEKTRWERDKEEPEKPPVLKTYWVVRINIVFPFKF